MMTKKKTESVVKTFRLRKDISDQLEILKNIENVTLQHIISNALIEYLDKNLTKASKQLQTISKLKTEEINSQHMYIPIKYYAEFNELTIIEIKKLIKEGTVKSLTLGENELIMIDINESMYKKAELLSIKNNISSMAKKLRKLENEFSSFKRKSLAHSL